MALQKVCASTTTYPRKICRPFRTSARLVLGKNFFPKSEDYEAAIHYRLAMKTMVQSLI